MLLPGTELDACEVWFWKGNAWQVSSASQRDGFNTFGWLLGCWRAISEAIAASNESQVTGICWRQVLFCEGGCLLSWEGAASDNSAPKLILDMESSHESGATLLGLSYFGTIKSISIQVQIMVIFQQTVVFDTHHHLWCICFIHNGGCHKIIRKFTQTSHLFLFIENKIRRLANNSLVCRVHWFQGWLTTLLLQIRPKPTIPS